METCVRLQEDLANAGTKTGKKERKEKVGKRRVPRVGGGVLERMDHTIRECMRSKERWTILNCNAFYESSRDARSMPMRAPWWNVARPTHRSLLHRVHSLARYTWRHILVHLFLRNRNFPCHPSTIVVPLARVAWVFVSSANTTTRGLPRHVSCSIVHTKVERTPNEQVRRIPSTAVDPSTRLQPTRSCASPPSVFSDGSKSSSADGPRSGARGALHRPIGTWILVLGARTHRRTRGKASDLGQ